MGMTRNQVQYPHQRQLAFPAPLPVGLSKTSFGQTLLQLSSRPQPQTHMPGPQQFYAWTPTVLSCSLLRNVMRRLNFFDRHVVKQAGL